VEAYLGPHDLAAHSARGLTPRTKIMFGPPGHMYVYFVYGMHWCANVVTQAEGTASAVLLRALEPVKNVEARTNGPALLCRAMAIDGRQNGPRPPERRPLHPSARATSRPSRSSRRPPHRRRLRRPPLGPPPPALLHPRQPVRIKKNNQGQTPIKLICLFLSRPPEQKIHA
jgi:hypothetical protein